jgi:hypothetical protein
MTGRPRRALPRDEGVRHGRYGLLLCFYYGDVEGLSAIMADGAEYTIHTMGRQQIHLEPNTRSQL